MGSVSFFKSLLGFKALLAVSGLARRIVVKHLKLRIIADNPLDYRRNPLDPLNRRDNEKRNSGFSGFLRGFIWFTRLQKSLDRFSGLAYRIVVNPLKLRIIIEDPSDFILTLESGLPDSLGRSQGVPGTFPGRSRDVPRAFPGCSRGVPLQSACSRGVPGAFPGRSRGVPGAFPGVPQQGACSRDVPGAFPGRSRGVPGAFPGNS